MTRFFSLRTVLGRLEIALAVLVITATVSFINLAIFADKASGKASAINVAGSLRMQAYVMGLTLADTHLTPEEKQLAVETAVLEFDLRLSHPSIVAAMPINAEKSLMSVFTHMSDEWRQDLRPLLLQTRLLPNLPPEVITSIRIFVADVEDFVARLDQALERQIMALKLIQGGLLLLILVTVFFALFVLHRQLNNTMSDLLRFARGVKTDDLTVRVPTTGNGEFSVLAETFNLMADHLSELYGTLETQVAQKTEELKRSNHALSLLYETGRLLSVRPLSAERLQQVLMRVETDVNLPAIVICAFNPNQPLGFPLAVNDAERLCMKDHSPVDCAACHATTKTRLRPSTAYPDDQLLNVPLMDADNYLGTMLVKVPNGTHVETWQIELLEAVGRRIGSALAGVEFSRQERLVALLEERTAIARELHDSLAQSLSYLKIQVARLTRLINTRQLDQANAVVAELGTGLSDAYRQLRQLLTTFRIQFDGTGLSQALASILEEFRQRGLANLHINNTLADIDLSANEQIHVLQIIREALANVEHHAQTPNAWVTIKRDETNSVHVVIEDDGVCNQGALEKRHHFGLSIMRERAEILGGSLTVSPRPAAGLQVELRFQPKMVQQEIGPDQRPMPLEESL